MSGVLSCVLVANRGEIALRVIRTLRRMGIEAAAVYSDADAGARHVREADVAVRLGPAEPTRSYLDVAAVVAAARAVGADALHPGYGFLSENPALPAACADAGIVFVGPPAAAIEAMGDKIRAKQTVSAAGVPVVPGRSGAGLSDQELVAAALEVGLPVLLKPSAGGGGKGMHRVDDPGALPAAIAAARREARGAFGDDTLLVERWVQRPRHIEIQVLFDAHGHGVHLGERECSLQRRHQKVVEETPSVLLGEDLRAAMGASAMEAARAVGYVGAGTVELIVSADRPEAHFFMEMNTRLQVEHPVTEAVTGIDLVEWQLRVAAGEPLGFDQAGVHARGHAVEARVYAEDPARGFVPSSGRLAAWCEPDPDRHPGVRVDSGVAAGDVVGTHYDPMLAKVVAHGADRSEALARLDAALASTVALGVVTNIGFLRRLLAHPDVVAGRLDTGLVERDLGELAGGAVPDEVMVAAATYRLLRPAADPPAADLWSRPGGWRLGGPPAECVVRLACRDREDEVGVTGHPSAATVRVGGSESRAVSARLERGDPDVLAVEVGGILRRWSVAGDGATVWVGGGGEAWALWPAGSGPATGGPGAGPGGGVMRSPMPGTVRAVHAEVGAPVTAGQAVVTVEAMKMEYAVASPADGILVALSVRPGQTVALEEVLAEVGAAPARQADGADRPARVPEDGRSGGRAG